MTIIATNKRSGLPGPQHIQRLEKLVSDHNELDFVGIEPTLDFDFTDIRGAAFNGNFTRATTGGYRLNNKGLLVSTVANEPVINFGVDGKAKGTEFYNAYTNLLTYSEQIDNAWWTKARCTISANATVAPDGNSIADKIVEDTTASNNHFIENNYLGATASTVYTFSVYLKAGERTRAQMSVWNGSTGVGAIFNLSTGTIVNNISSGISAIESIGNGWYRCSVTFTMATTSTAYCDIFLDNGTSTSYTGDGSSGLYVWGAQLTATSFPVPYVPTTTAAVTRNADSMVISGTDFADFFNPVEGTVFVEAKAPTNITTGYPSLVVFDNGGQTERIIIVHNAAGSCFEISTGTASTLQAYSAPSINSGALFKVAFSFKNNRFLASLNGTLVMDDVSGVMPTGVNRLAISGGYNIWNSNILRIVYWPKALTATELRRITK